MKHQLPTIHPNLTEEDWQDLRRSRFTASEIHKLMGTPKSKSEFLSETAKSFVFERAAEYLTGNRTEIYGRALDWGKENEKEAFHYFQQQSDDFYTYYGAESYTFITYGLWGGYSPTTPKGLTPGQRDILREFQQLEQKDLSFAAHE